MSDLVDSRRNDGIRRIVAMTDHYAVLVGHELIGTIERCSETQWGWYPLGDARRLTGFPPPMRTEHFRLREMIELAMRGQ